MDWVLGLQLRVLALLAWAIDKDLPLGLGNYV